MPQGPSRRFFPWNSQNFWRMHVLQSWPVNLYIRRRTSMPTFRLNVTLLVGRICWQSWQRPMPLITADAWADTVADMLVSSRSVGYRDVNMPSVSPQSSAPRLFPPQHGRTRSALSLPATYCGAARVVISSPIYATSVRQAERTSRRSRFNRLFAVGAQHPVPVPSAQPSHPSPFAQFG